MNPVTEINQRVAVISSYDPNRSVDFTCYPRKMRYKNQDITFTKYGMHHPTSKGTRMIHVFDMSDEANDYRLEFDAENLAWTLVSIMEGHHVRK